MNIKLKNVIHKLNSNSKDKYDKDYEIIYRIIYSMAFSVCENVDLSYTITKSVINKLKALPESEMHSHEMINLCNASKNEATLFMRPNHSISGYTIDDVKQVDMSDISDVSEYLRYSPELDDSNRDVVTLKLIGNFKNSEIADILGISRGSVRGKLNYKNKNLNTKLVISLLVSFIFSILAFYSMYMDKNKIVDLARGIGTSSTDRSIGIMTIIYFICLGISAAVSVYFIIRECKEEIDIDD